MSIPISPDKNENVHTLSGIIHGKYGSHCILQTDLATCWFSSCFDLWKLSTANDDLDVYMVKFLINIEEII
jgi:hypothetical protein